MKSEKFNTIWSLKCFLPYGDSKNEVELLKKAEVNVLEFVDKWSNRDDWLKDVNVLKQALDDYEYLSKEYGLTNGISYFFGLKYALERNNHELKAKLNKINDQELKLINLLEFFALRLSKISKDKKEEFVKSKELIDYKHFLEHLFANSKYLLSEKEEKILNLMSTPAYGNWVEMTQNFLLKEEKDEKSFAEWMSLLASTNKVERDSAADFVNFVFKKHADVATEELNSILHTKKVTDELRGIKRPEQSRLNSDDIDIEVVDSLVKSVSQKFNLSSRYYKLKAKALNFEKLKYHERNVPVGKIEQEFSFNDSVEIVKKAFKNLDPEFEEIFCSFLENGQIDAFPRVGKMDGAFCTHDSKKFPSFVLLNHTNKLRDVTTMAHEMGHAINNELIRKNQNELNFGTPLSTAEVASTFFEDFVLDEISKDLSDKEKYILNMERLNDFVSTVQRQIACYKFEQELHLSFRDLGYLPKEKIGEIFSKHMSSYMGDFVEQSKGSQNWWVYWSHIRSYFYVYSYASGLLISKSLQNMIRKNPKDILKVKTFLSAGLFRSPKDIFLDLDIDITKEDFWMLGLQEFETLLTETEKLKI